MISFTFHIFTEPTFYCRCVFPLHTGFSISTRIPDSMFNILLHRLTMHANICIHANKIDTKATFISMWVFPPCLHMEMLFWCVTGQGNISIPNPTTLHHWNCCSATTFGSHNTETRLKNLGRGWFPVFSLVILAEARLLSSLWADVCVGRCAQPWAGTGRPQEGGQDIPHVCPCIVPWITSQSCFSRSSQALSVFTGIRLKSPHMNI